jgi:lipopolysaccharide biosynthesis glycosyltransferase
MLRPPEDDAPASAEAKASGVADPVERDHASAVTAVSFTANDTYLVPAVVVLESLRQKIPDGLELIVRDTGLSAKARTLLERQADRTGCSASFTRYSAREFQSAPLLGHWTDPAAFARLFPYDDRHRFVLDLDVDLLAREPLHDLLARAPDASSALLAVPTHYTPTLWSEEVGDASDFGIRESSSFFMGGVCIIDTAKWNDVSTESLTLFRRDPSRWRGDLSILNVVCSKSWSALSSRWNVWTLPRRGPFRYVRVDGATPRAIVRSRNVAIAHFPGHFKPWLRHYPPNRWRLEYHRVWRRSILKGGSDGVLERPPGRNSAG